MTYNNRFANKTFADETKICSDSILPMLLHNSKKAYMEYTQGRCAFSPHWLSWCVVLFLIFHRLKKTNYMRSVTVSELLIFESEISEFPVIFFASWRYVTSDGKKTPTRIKALFVVQVNNYVADMKKKLCPRKKAWQIYFPSILIREYKSTDYMRTSSKSMNSTR